MSRRAVPCSWTSEAKMEAHVEGDQDEEAFVGAEDAGSRCEVVQSLRCFFDESYSDYRRVRGVYKIGKTRVINFAHGMMGAERKLLRWPEKSRPYLGYDELGPEGFLKVVEKETGKSVPRLFKKSHIEGPLFLDYSLWALEILREDIQARSPGKTSGLLWLPVDRFKDPTFVRDIFFSPGYWSDWSWKVILEERSDCGVVQWGTPKPEIDRVLPVGPLSASEAKEFVRSRLVRTIPKGGGGRVPEIVVEAVVALAGRHPELLLVAANSLMSDLRLEGVSAMADQSVAGISEFIFTSIAARRPMEIKETVDLLVSALSEKGREKLDELSREPLARIGSGRLSQGGKELGLAGFLSEEGELVRIIARTIRPQKDFFLSFASADKAWADWIAWTLREAG